MAGIWTVRSRITAATQFSGAAAIVTFNEFKPLDAMSPSFTARIVNLAYTSSGAAQTIRLWLRSVLNIVPNTDDDILLRSETLTNNTFSTLCGPQGIVVPRDFGIRAQDQQPPTTTVFTAASYRLFFTTTDKAAAGTFWCTYRLAEEDG